MLDINNCFCEINKYTHFFNWGPDWGVVADVYKTFPESYSILTPFAYSYLEELIRSTTSEYGRELYDVHGNVKKIRKVGIKLIVLAINENRANIDYINLLEEAKQYFKTSEWTDKGDNRNSVIHGYMHPRFWDKDSFETLIHFISKISKYSRF